MEDPNAPAKAMVIDGGNVSAENLLPEPAIPPLSATMSTPEPVDTAMVDALGSSFENIESTEAQKHITSLERLDEKICDALQAASDALRTLTVAPVRAQDADEGISLSNEAMLATQKDAFQSDVARLCATLQEIEVGFDSEIGSLIDAGRLAPVR